MRSVVTSTGPSAQRTGERFGFATCGTDASEAFADEAVDLVFVTTQHDTHAALAEQALRANKAVWLEKPVGLDLEEIDAVARAAEDTSGLLMVGFNRRFSSHARAIREAFARRSSPASIHYAISAGAAPAGTWLMDPKVGGGRIVGEVCHFVDLCTYLIGAVPIEVSGHSISSDRAVDDSTTAVLRFADGSIASLSYLANSSTELPKERFEMHAEGRSALCDNYRVTQLPGGESVKGVNQDKGQRTALQETLAAVRGGQGSPIPLGEIVGVSRATAAIVEAIDLGRPVQVSPWTG